MNASDLMGLMGGGNFDPDVLKAQSMANLLRGQTAPPIQQPVMQPPPVRQMGPVMGPPVPEQPQTQQTQQPRRALPRAMQNYKPPPQVPPAMQPQPQPPGDIWDQRIAALQPQRQQAEAEMEAAFEPPNREDMEKAFQRRVEQSHGDMLRALAAIEAGKEFAPIAQSYIHRSDEAIAPMKVTGGTMTAQGFIEDSGYKSEQQFKRAQARLEAIRKAEEFNLTQQERARLQEERIAAQKEMKEAMMANQLAIAGIVHGGKGGGEGGGAAGPGKADYAGVDAATGKRVIEDKYGREWIQEDGPNGPTFKPQTGQTIPKAAHEKNVAQGTELAQASAGAGSLLAKVESHPNAFTVATSVASRFPALLGRSTALKMAGATPADIQLRANFAQQAAAEMSRLYGAAQSAGEADRASQFLIDVKNDDHDAIVAKLKGAQAYAADAAKRWGPATTRAVKERTGIDVNAPAAPAGPAPAPRPAPGAVIDFNSLP